MDHISIDSETMGTGPKAAIVSIGAVRLDIEAGTIDNNKFYRVINLKSAVDAGGEMDAETVLWWMNQDASARHALTESGGENIAAVLHELGEWMTQGKKTPVKDLCLWGNGTDFDNVILAGAYQRLGLPVPWPFYGNRCFRTLKALHPHVPMERIGTYHHALDDAETQAMHILKILNHNSGT